MTRVRLKFGENEFEYEGEVKADFARRALDAFLKRCGADDICETETDIPVTPLPPIQPVVDRPATATTKRPGRMRLAAPQRRFTNTPDLHPEEVKGLVTGHAALTVTQEKVWIELATSISKNGLCPSWVAISDKLGLYQPDVVKATKDLEGLGYIRREGTRRTILAHVLKWPDGIVPRATVGRADGFRLPLVTIPVAEPNGPLPVAPETGRNDDVDIVNSWVLKAVFNATRSRDVARLSHVAHNADIEVAAARTSLEGLMRRGLVEMPYVDGLYCWKLTKAGEALAATRFGDVTDDAPALTSV